MQLSQMPDAAAMRKLPSSSKSLGSDSSPDVKPNAIGGDEAEVDLRWIWLDP